MIFPRIFPFDDEFAAAAPHVDIADPQIVVGTAVLGEVYGDVAPIEELPGRKGLGEPQLVDTNGRCLDRRRRQE